MMGYVLVIIVAVCGGGTGTGCGIAIDQIDFPSLNACVNAKEQLFPADTVPPLNEEWSPRRELRCIPYDGKNNPA